MKRTERTVRAAMRNELTRISRDGKTAYVRKCADRALALYDRTDMLDALKGMVRLYESKWSDEPPELTHARAVIEREKR